MQCHHTTRKTHLHGIFLGGNNFFFVTGNSLLIKCCQNYEKMYNVYFPKWFTIHRFLILSVVLTVENVPYFT